MRARSRGLPDADERLLLGVCSSVARLLRVDPTLVRLAVLVLTLAWGLGAVAYAAGWLWLRAEGGGLGWAVPGSWPALREAWRGTDQDPGWPLPLGKRWVGLALVALGIGIVLASLGLLDWLTPGRALGCGLAALGAAMLVSLSSEE